MKKDFVKDWMTANPISVSPKTHLYEAHDLMKQYSIRRLPVVEDGKVIGIVTLGDVREAGPSDATSLSIFELNFLIAKLTVEDIMTKDPITLPVDASLHQAAQVLLDNKISGLPVMDGNKLVGIITESDVFRAVIEVCV